MITTDEHTDWKAEAAEAMQLLAGVSIPVSDVPVLRGYAVIELHSLDDLRRFCEGAFVYVSKIRGYWMYIPTAGE